jgi:hypothetical protein
MANPFSVWREASASRAPGTVRVKDTRFQFNLFMQMGFLGEVPSLQRRRLRIAT